jgi:quercetin dioxygenase-like cupin family protein
MGDVKVVALRDVPAAELPNHSWSRVLITRDRVDDNKATLGVSLFTPGTVTAAVIHEVEEVIYVTRGHGELRTDQRSVPFTSGDALFVPARTWHWVANTGDEDAEMIFGFPYPEYPPTQRRER